MKRKIYLETTIASYLAARSSRDLVVAAHQSLTLEWWADQRARFDLFVSDLVLQEASKGDAVAAAKRMELLKDIPILQTSEAAIQLAGSLIQAGLIPRGSTADALHIAIATTQGMEFLLTWNCRHIANAEVIERFESLLSGLGYRMPMLCTPEQLMGS